MPVKLSPRIPRVPLPLQRRSTEEYTPLPYSSFLRKVVARVRAESPERARRLSMSLPDYWSGRQGTAAALRAISEEAGGGFYNIPEEAALDLAAADEALGGDQLVVDLQGHYIAERPPGIAGWDFDILLGISDIVGADQFKDLGKLVRNQHKAGITLAEFLRLMYLESDTGVVVLTSAPGPEGLDSSRMLTNPQLIGTREMIDRLAGTGRLINHCVVHPNIAGDIDKMDLWKDWCRPAGWKVYTQYGSAGEGPMHWDSPTWFLDDEASGIPFLDRVRTSGSPVVCAHKGLSGGSDPGWNGPASPRDIGPVAAAYPDITFIVYHSGYEPREGDPQLEYSTQLKSSMEGPYSEEVAHTGTNRLIKSLKDAKIGPGGNVYCELGTTWYLIMAHPTEAAHVIGKLLSAVGEDNIVWGTDCIFYGSPQPLIDAFRAFQIPEEYCQRYGYPQLTPTAKEKILGLNAARIYNMDTAKVKAATRTDDVAWVKAALEEYKAKGTPAVV